MSVWCLRKLRSLSHFQLRVWCFITNGTLHHQGVCTSNNFNVLSIAKRDEAVQFNKELEWIQQSQEADQLDDLEEPCQTNLTPYSLQRHHGLPDKSVADCVEALIGCYLTTCGRKAALMFMSWLGLKVLPKKKKELGDRRCTEDCSDRTNLWKVK